MALIKTSEEIETLREGGKILAAILKLLEKRITPGVSTMDLENLALAEIKKAGAEPAFKGYQPGRDQSPFPAALCTSIDAEVVHCIPKDNRVLKEGEIISLDLGIKYKGLFTDAAITVPVGRVTAEAQKLLRTTERALAAGIAQIKPGNTIGDIAHAIEKVGKSARLGVIRDLIGHGVGHAVHESPSVPNYGKPGTLEKLEPGMVLAIEPMFTLGDFRIKFLDDGWTVITADGSLAAHFEHTVAVTETGYIVLTR